MQRHWRILTALTQIAVANIASGQALTASLVDVGGRKVNVQVAGTAKQGAPTVVFESGLGSALTTWNPVQAEIAKVTKTIAYERAGVGRSEAGPAPRNVKRFVAELHALLAALNTPPPYVLVGHSYGGPIIHTFAATYPKEVVGLVYVDPTDFTQTEADMQDIWTKAGVKDGHNAMAGFMKQALTASPPGIVAEAEDFQRVERGGFAEFREAGDPPNMPTSVLLAGFTEALPPTIAFPGNAAVYFQAMLDQRVDHFVRFVRKSPKAHLVFTSSSAHFIHATEPELVTSEISGVLSAASPRPELQRFVGDYTLAPTLVMSITRDGDKLFLQATGQPKFQMFADSPTAFSLRIVDAKIEFETDAGGTATGLVLVQNGARQRAPKKN